MEIATATTFLTKFDDSKRAMAKLLARENITVQIVAGAPTASFDVARRILTIPNWESLTLDQFDMLIGHEVGHALFTNQSYIETLCKTRKNAGTLKTYWNICEDAYIERKMKNCYPGLQRIFYNAYQTFHTSGPILKGTRTHLINPSNGQHVAIASMKLIDRINLFYKLGAFVDVPFSDVEKTFIRMIDKITCTEDAVKIAQKLMAFAKDQQNQQNPSPSPDQSQKPSQKPSEPSQDQQDQQDPSDEGDEDTKSTEQSDDSTDEADTEADKNDADRDDQKADKEADTDDDASEANGNDSENTEADESSSDDDNAGDADSDTDSDTDSDADGDSDSDTDSDEGDEAEQGSKASNGPEGSKGSDEDFEDTSDTLTDAEQGLRNLAAPQDANNRFRHLVIAPLPADVLKARTITATEYTAIMENGMGAYVDKSLDTLYDTWKMQYAATAKLMAQEFTRRKSAKQLLHASTARTGRLNMSKLHQFKYAEDLFLRTVSVPTGQSHGIVMVVDASGSMSGVFADVLDQILLFAHFAYASNIPFEAYMFTDAHGTGYTNEWKIPAGTGLLSLQPSDDGRLVGLVNTTERSMFKRHVRTVLALRSRYNQGSVAAGQVNAASYRVPFTGLNGTPLYTGVMLGEGHVARMKKTLRLDKMVFMVVTDGGDGGGLRYLDTDTDYTDGSMHLTEQNITFLYNGCVVRDTVTKINHVLAESSSRSTTALIKNAWMSLLLNVIKTRHQCSTVYLFLSGATGSNTTGRSRRRRYYSGNGIDMDVNQMTTKNLDVTEEMTAQYREDKQLTVPAEYSVADVAVIVRSSSVALTEDEFESVDATNMTQKAVSKKFEETMTGRVTNRKFVNTVMPFIA